MTGGSGFQPRFTRAIAVKNRSHKQYRHYESTKFLFRSDWTLAVSGGAYMKLRQNGTVFDD